ncbi:MAG TPA: LuxR C-terminal-related transcriptional regulator [Solirubrobacteraceae bacterium]|nr:LuxR C-terminal-related transcriptional regulator [Solirubrobacteraceae bacterium]
MEAPASKVFVGRARELGQLGRALDATRVGSGTTALVSGEAGIGKTRLASVLAARARDAGFEVLLGRSIDLVGAELPYQPFVEALRPLGRLRGVYGPTAGSQLRFFEETLALLAAHADAPPPAALTDAIVARSEGNPLFAEELLAAAQATGSFRFRHSLLAEAIYSTILPGEREELHARLARELARSGGAAAAELAPHWAAAGRTREALAASVEAARQAEAVFGLAEALAHLERALALWPAVADAAELVHLDLAELCSWSAELADQTGAAPRAVQLAQQAIGLVGDSDRLRAALLHERLGRYLHTSGRGDAALPEFERAVALAPARPPSPERAQALAALATGLSLAWRYDESLAICEQALALARAVGARQAELRALTVLGIDLAYLGRGDEGLARLWQALRLAEAGADPVALERAYVALTDVLMMLGRPRESARLAETALDVLRPYGRDHSTLVANRIEALVAGGDWDDADRLSAAALRAIIANYPHQPLVSRAELEVGRGDFDQARAHHEAARATLRLDRDLATYAAFVAELALWERRWVDAEQIVTDGLARARSRDMAQIRVWLCAKGLRAQAELAALARARRDGDAVGERLGRARKLLATACHAAAQAAAVTPNAAGWRALAEAEYQRAVASPDPKPLSAELEQLAQRARLEIAPPVAGSPDRKQGLEEILGLTPREAEVLTLVARGYTNREIAATLVISVRTAGVHVSHILRKLGAPNRLEAAAIAHRLSPPHVGQAQRNA